MESLSRTTLALDDELLEKAEALVAALFGIGIGFVDAHLLTAVRLSPGALVLTRDKWLVAASEMH